MKPGTVARILYLSFPAAHESTTDPERTLALAHGAG
jgi:hypothetical protein